MATEIKTNENIRFRDFKAINENEFNEELKEIIRGIHIGTSLQNVVDTYNYGLNSLVEKHAPVKEKVMKINKNAPWFDAEYKQLRAKKRKAEKQFRKSKANEDKEKYKQLRLECSKIAKMKKKEFYVNKINLSTNKLKTLFELTNQLLGKTEKVILPSEGTDTEIAESFRKHFEEKIYKIRKTIGTHKKDMDLGVPSTIGFNRLEKFPPTSIEELSQIIKEHKISTSPDDPFNGKLLCKNLDTLLPLWVDIVNLSLETGSMDCLKSAIVLPMLKDKNKKTDPENYKNYRPVSNLVFISKLIERCVARRLTCHIKTNDLESKYQFGYKQDHSTELLLLNMTDDILRAFEKKS
eukprot:gene2629-3043_t